MTREGWQQILNMDQKGLDSDKLNRDQKGSGYLKMNMDKKGLGKNTQY